ncbi:hypothetical protein INT47_008656 [Mucor saturninus]|uniref:HIT domain-containing protein n=1 Tax=Mucor saturninus TaxID=64648 RepID=A0A8H7URW7_9FUNG|nr:hypothetical protein INT47_008656 [Mucor saturninus]
MACCSVGKKKECIFCHIGDSVGARIVIETEQLVAFRDRSPSSQVHLLVIPKQHVRTVKDLDGGHVALCELNHFYMLRVKTDRKRKVQDMVDLGKRLLKEQGFNPEDATQTRLGFHVPPFNSVDHLHLHVMGLPFRGWKGLKYNQKYPWFVNAGTVLRRLGEGMSPV